MVLNDFIPGYSEIEGDYAFNLTTERTFDNEKDILEYLESTRSERGTIHWNKDKDNPSRIMVGAYFTSDGELIFSLTIVADGSKEEKYFQSLKDVLGSDIGVISYNQFPAFESGEDFRNKYGRQGRRV